MSPVPGVLALGGHSRYSEVQLLYYDRTDKDEIFKRPKYEETTLTYIRAGEVQEFSR